MNYNKYLVLFSADGTITVGVLHSLRAPWPSANPLKDTILFLIDEQNKKGGVLGKELEAVVVDPASNWPLFAEKARALITKDKVAVVFGCWISVFAQIRVAGVQGTEFDPVLSRALPVDVRGLRQIVDGLLGGVYLEGGRVFGARKEARHRQEAFRGRKYPRRHRQEEHDPQRRSKVDI